MSTQKKFSNMRGVIVVVLFLALTILPFAQIGGAQPMKINKSQLPQDKEKWWKDWAGDMNRNKIHDALEEHLTKENPEPEQEILVIADYDHVPTKADENRLTSRGWDVRHVSKYVDCIAVRLTIGDIDTLASLDEVVMVEYAPDGEFTLNSALPSIGVPEVWEQLGYDGEGVTICIIDTGIDDEHAGLDDLDDDPDTDDPKVIAFYDAVNHPNQDDGTYEPYDNHGHGTHCSGIAAGTGAPGGTYIGVAPQAYLVGVKIGGGSIPYDAAIRGVEWAIDNKDKFGIDILSNSWGIFIGGPGAQNGESTISRLMDEAVDAGLVVFCAAGNTAVSMTVYAPADSEKAITVGSVNDEHVLSYFSSQGPTADGRIKPDICTIGEEVRSPNANSGTGYGGFSGTSAACPMAAGLAGLILQANPDLSPEDVKQIMHETSEHNTDARFPASPNNGYGWGVVEAYGAAKRARDLRMTFINSLPIVHEGDIINFTTNTTYTRTEFTYKGEDGIRIIGDDVLLFVISIPANWSIPFNIVPFSEGDLEYDIFYSMPRFEDNMWILEVEFHYNENVNETTEATPIVMFQSMTPTVEYDTTYPIFLNITLNNINATKVVRNITVDNQDPPVVILDSPGDGDSIAGIVMILGRAYDPDVGDEVERVDIKIKDGDWETANGTTNWEYEWNTTEVNNGWYDISSLAYDGEEYSSYHNISVYVDNFNLQPYAVIDSISPNPANEGEDVSFSGHGEDDDGYIVEYEWRSNIDGKLSNQSVFSNSSLSVGIHEISLSVKDNDGVWSQRAIMSLRINQIPIAYIDSISPDPANEGEIVSFLGHGGDDGNIVAYNWRSSIDGFLSDSAFFNTSGLSIGDHVIYFRVQDDDGQWSSEISEDLRINQIPTAFIDSITPNPAEENETVSFVGHGEDDSGIIDYEWLSSIDGFLGVFSSFENDSLSVGEHVISFRVKDDDNAWSDYVFQDLNINPVPKAHIDSISPNPANESEAVSFTGHGTGEGEIINYNWSSSISGFLSDSSSFSTTDLVSGVHTIIFSVQNEYGVWSDYAQEVLRINGLPTAVIDSISPNPALEGEDVLFEGHGVDDLEIIEYSWYSSIDGFLNDSFSFTANLLSVGIHNITFSVQDSDLVWAEEVFLYLRVHEHPKAHIDDLSPNPANFGEEVVFTGHGSDDGLIVGYEWYSDIDGLLSPEPSFSVSSLSLGEHEISFRVMDDDGVWSEFAVFQLRINQIPTALIDNVSPSPANQGESVSFSGHGLDDREIVDYEWRSNIDGTLSSLESFSTSKLSIGQHVIFFSVKDDDGAWSEEVTINLRINQIPTAHIDSFPPSFVNEGNEITFIGHGSDDGYITAYEWSSSIDGILSDEDSFTISSLSVGEHVITFSVMDDLNVWSSSIWMILKINQIPKAYIESITPNPAMSHESFYFVGYGVDDKDIADYEWISNIDGYLGDSEAFSRVGLSAGRHIISFKVKDKNGVWSEEDRKELLVHDRPKAIIKSILPNSPNDDDVISFIGEGEDDGFIKAYEWTSSIDGILNDKEVFDEILSYGTHTISLKVMDDMNEWSLEAKKKVHVNGVPSAFIDSILPNPAIEGDSVSLSGHGLDEGSIVAYEWRSSLDGIIGSESSLILDYLSPGTHDIYFKVKDDNDVWSEEVLEVLNIDIRINQAPNVEIVTPYMGELFSDVITIQATADDADGQIERIELRIDDNEWIKISDSNEAFYSLEPKDISEGEHVLYIRAYDGEDYSEEEFVIIEVYFGEEEEFFDLGNSIFLISLILIIIIIIICIIVLGIWAARRRRRSQIIRL